MSLINEKKDFSIISSLIPERSSVIDIGCNDGSLLEYLQINKKVEDQRFRGNLYVDGIEAWEERDWIGKIIKINNISFKVEKNIPRCVAINLKPKTDDNSINLLKSLKI